MKRKWRGKQGTKVEGTKPNTEGVSVDYYTTLEMIREHCRVIQSSPVPEADEIREDHLVILAGIEATLRFVSLTVAPEVWVGDPEDPARGGRPMAQKIK